MYETRETERERERERERESTEGRMPPLRISGDKPEGEGGVIQTAQRE
jgi:hypothetical protein